MLYADINSVPRKMISDEVSEVLQAYDFEGYAEVIVSVPGGDKIAQHTFNPRLGIEGGISIIGTSGIVEPMSRQAILDTIQVELRQKYAEGCSSAFISPGNYGLDFMRDTYGVDLDRSVKCSNYIGETIDMIANMTDAEYEKFNALLREYVQNKLDNRKLKNSYIEMFTQVMG